MQAHLAVCVLVGVQNRGEIAIRSLDQIRTTREIARMVLVRVRLVVEAAGPSPGLPAILGHADAGAIPLWVFVSMEADDRAGFETVQLEVRPDETGRLQGRPRGA